MRNNLRTTVDIVGSVADYLRLLSLVVAVAAGLVAVTVSAILARSRQTAFFRYFLTQILLFNLLTLGGLVFRFAEFDVGRGDGATPAWLLPALLGTLAVLKLAWLYSFVAMTLALARREPPRRFKIGFGVVSGAILVYGLASLLAAKLSLGSGVALAVFSGVVEIVTLGVSLVTAITLLLAARALPAGRRRGAIAGLGAVYAVLLGVVVSSLLLGWLRHGGPTPGHVVFNGALLTAFNLLPLLWALRVEPPRAADIGIGFGLTQREREIVALIADGLTNQEIADRLFISVATVKDHNYNIFRKTGVRNRVELAGLVNSGVGRSNTPGGDAAR